RWRRADHAPSLRAPRGHHGRRLRAAARGTGAQPARPAAVPRVGYRSRRAARRSTLRGAHAMSVVRLDDLDAIELPDGFVWRPVRRHFDIRAFGVNAYTAREAGGQIVEEHTEGSLGHEEIYLVLRGRARFTVDGNDHELGAGQLVFVRDPALRRGAVALTDDTIVLAPLCRTGRPQARRPWQARGAPRTGGRRGRRCSQRYPPGARAAGATRS